LTWLGKKIEGLCAGQPAHKAGWADADGRADARCWSGLRISVRSRHPSKTLARYSAARTCDGQVNDLERPSSRNCLFGSGESIAVSPPRKVATWLRLKFPAGYKVAPHVHPNDEDVTVISGTFHIGFGDKFDESRGQAIKCGSARYSRSARAARPSRPCSAFCALDLLDGVELVAQTARGAGAPGAPGTRPFRADRRGVRGGQKVAEKSSFWWPPRRAEGCAWRTRRTTMRPR